jgi:hypothetical protein
MIAPLVSNSREPSEEDIEFAIRRIRNWTVAGALVPVGDHHSGSGKHRRYDDSSVYIAATMSVLADADQSIGVLLAVARLIRNLFGDNPLINLFGDNPLIAGNMLDRWNSAVRGESDIFLMVNPGPTRGQPREIASAQVLVSRDEVDEVLRQWRTGVFVNLTTAFAQTQRFCQGWRQRNEF